MKKVDLIVAADHVLTMEGDGVGYKSNIAFVIDNGRIADIGCRENIMREYTAKDMIDKENTLVMPGLIDAHMHMAETTLRGLAQDTGYWMMYGVGPFEPAIGEKERILGVKLGVLEGVKAGTTTFGEWHSDLEQTCKLMEKVGVRAHLTSKIREAEERIYAPGEIYEYNKEKGEESFNEAIRLFEKWNNAANGRIKILFGPQGPDFASEEMLLKVQKEAKKRGTLVHMHTQQGDRETYQVVKRYGKRPVQWLDSIGYLDETLIAVHLTDANEEEAALVAKRGASMILCSGSIGIIDGIVPPANAFQLEGGNVALGSDQAPGNNCHNIFNEMKLTALFNKIRYSNPETMPAWRTLRMATIEGAKALGLGNDIGSLEIGKKADMIVLDLNSPSMLPVYTMPMRNFVPNIVYSANGSEVIYSIIDGKIIYKDGIVNSLDKDEIAKEVNEAAQIIGQKSSEVFWNVNGTNAQFMKDGKL